MTRIYKAFALATLALASVACDTDVESLKINEPSISEQNPELYQAYLQDLRAYKQGEHKVAIAYLDNSRAQSTTQAQRISAVPDSLDYLVLTHPTNISELDAREIKENREQKGTKTLYTIDFEHIKQVHAIRVQEFEMNEANAGKTYTPSLNDFLVDSVAKSLEWCNKYGYDGIVMAYAGREKDYLTPLERQTYTSYEHIFIGMTLDWASRNPRKELLLQGLPQNIFSQEVLERAKYILIDVRAAEGKSDAVLIAEQAAAEQVPGDKLVPLVSTYSLDKDDKKTGYWGSDSAILGAARWVNIRNPRYDLAGLAMYNIGNDYFTPAFTFGTVRQAVNIINPSIKK